jgi:multidrug efflux system membrane fusion protein
MNNVQTIRTFATLLLASLVTGCVTTEAIPQAPQAVQTRRVVSPAAVNGGSLRYSAVVESDADVPLSFRIPGYVVALQQVRASDGSMRDIAEGDRVAKGAVLVRIRASEYDERVRQAKSQAAAAEAVALKAKLDFDRATRLFDTQSMTKSDFDAARAQYDATQSELHGALAQVSEAEIALHDTSLVAPFGADIVKKTVEPGAFVGPGVTVLALAKMDVVKIVVGVPDTTVRSITLGQPVDVTVDAMADRAVHARVTRIASAADPRTRNFEVEVAIPNRDFTLKAGMIGSLQFAVKETDRNASAFTIPLSAIVQAGEGRYGVFIVVPSNEGGTAALRQIEVGEVVGTEISVASGLSAGDEVITTGANLLKDGQRVEVVR